MKSLRTPLYLICLFLAAASVQAQQASVEDFDWLAGCWQGETEGKKYFENWMRPSGHMIMGLSRTEKDGKAMAYENLQIVLKENTIYYAARPLGQQETLFKLVKSGSRQATFENPEHDFPQRIIYRLEGDDFLFARIEGIKEGKLQAVDFPMKRVKCDLGSSW